MAAESLTRSSAINLINGSIDSFMISHACYCTSNMESLSEDDLELYDQMHEVISILNDDEDYRHDLETMPLEDLKEFLLMCRKMADNNNLSLKSEFPQGNFEIVEDEPEKTETELNPDKIENVISETFDSEVKLNEITYFINNYKSVANWEYNGHGSFIAKKNATLWELGGIYWNKLFELPPNPNLIHIGDEIHLKQEVIDKIYEVSTSDVTGEYSFDPKSPEAIDLIYGIICFCAGNKFPESLDKIIKRKDLADTVEMLMEKEETSSKLSYFIQQYATEGQEEDAWKKILTLVTFLVPNIKNIGIIGDVFSALGVLSSASIEDNRYQIVQYYSRKAFINSAQDEIERIKKIKSQVKEEQLETEINYLRFLEKQIKMITEEVRLNKLRDKQQLNEIRYYTSQHASTKDWEDSRYSKSPSYFHNLDYHKLFEEQK